MKLDTATIVAYPDVAAWAAYYAKFWDALVDSLSPFYCRADREDAVSEAFRKLMGRESGEAYGDRLPKTESDWFWALHWQSRSFLSRIKARSERHAKYVERTASELAGAFARADQGAALDESVCRRALERALELFRLEQGISARNLEIYLRLSFYGEKAKSLAARYKVTENNVYQIKFRVEKLLRKHGLDCLRRAIRAGDGIRAA